MKFFMCICISLCLLTTNTHAEEPEPQVTKKKANKKILVEDITKHLASAEEATVEEFFTKWMTKPPRKAQIGTWFILHQDETFVYWGKPIMGGFLQMSTRFVEQLYKTKKADLGSQFPSYDSVWGNTVRLALYDIMNEHRQSNANKERITLGIKDFFATLRNTPQGNQIEATVKANLYREKTAHQIVKYVITLNADNLSLITIVEK